MAPRIGILAVQGDFDAHARALEGAAELRLVKMPADLYRDGGIQGLVLPGGESTTMIRLLKLSDLWGELAELGLDADHAKALLEIECRIFTPVHSNIRDQSLVHAETLPRELPGYVAPLRTARDPALR